FPILPPRRTQSPSTVPNVVCNLLNLAIAINIVPAGEEQPGINNLLSNLNHIRCTAIAVQYYNKQQCQCPPRLPKRATECPALESMPIQCDHQPSDENVSVMAQHRHSSSSSSFPYLFHFSSSFYHHLFFFV